MTSVRFAVLQISVVVVAGLIGSLLPQLPAFSLRDPAAYAAQMAGLHQKFDSGWFGLGSKMVDVFERLGFFRVFSATWFIGALTLLVISIFVCTLDRTPRLWRGVRRVTVEQPAPFFDPRLAQRAQFNDPALAVGGASLAPDALAKVLRGRRFKIRRATASEGTESWVYGDRNQYFKMATLLTHLGLILFLAGGAVTAAFGFETVVFVGEGQTAPVQPVGTPHNLLVKNIRFEAPTRPDGSFEDFRTDLAVYQDGVQVARKVIRVNDPLDVAGFVFHQNTFGPSADVEVRGRDGLLLWTGPILLDDAVGGFPAGFFTIPGSPDGLLMILRRDDLGTPVLVLNGIGPSGQDGANAVIFQAIVGLSATTDPVDTAGYSITWNRAGAWTGMVIKNDPGAPIIWIAFVCLMFGLILSFYFPRRRVWARYDGGGLQLAMLADRYVDADREFESLLEELSRRAGRRPERRMSAASQT
ncbi:MAG: cytochrome c biogenesis protein ResB [Candidatus Limnocylindrales bacterium]